MHLYHLTLVPATSVSHVISGSFTGASRREIASLSSNHLTLYRVLHSSGELRSLFSTPLFGNARFLARFRLPGDRTDFAIVTSDAGSISVLRAVENHGWQKVACEFFGKSGVRRTVPGEFLAVDPKGRACMIAAVEKGRFTYVLNRDPEGHLSISSPLVRHKNAVSTFWAVGLDVGFENPMFAVLEKGYEKGSKKQLVYYELDLGLNHVVRKYAADVADSSYLMLAVPGGNDGPGGVLLCENGMVTYRNILVEEDESVSESMEIDHINGVKGGYRLPHTRLQAALPYPEGEDPKDTMIVSAAMHKYESLFFYILCTDSGDLIKCSLGGDSEKGATSLTLRYFDSLPGPASSLVILRAGYLFAAMESGDHLLLNFKHVGDDYDPAGGYSSTDPVTLFPLLSPPLQEQPAHERPPVKSASDQNAQEPQRDGQRQNPAAVQVVPKESSMQRAQDASVPSVESGTAVLQKSSVESSQTASNGDLANGVLQGPDDATKARLVRAKLSFTRRRVFRNLRSSDACDSLSPVVSFAYGNFLSTDTSQILVGCAGQGSQSCLKVLRRGVSVALMAEHELSATLTNVFTLKKSSSDSFHQYIVISFVNVTKVLQVGESTVSAVTNTQFLGNCRTLGAAHMGSRSMAQVHPKGIRYITGDTAEDWRTPDESSVLSVAMNSAQALVILSNGSVLYFEIDSDGGSSLILRDTLNSVLSTIDKMAAQNSGLPSYRGPIVAISDVAQGRTKASFMAVADGTSSTARLYRIDTTTSALSPSGLQMAPGPVSSIAIIDFSSSPTSSNSSERGMTFLIGTRTGGLTMSRLDPITGNLSAKRSRVLGSKAVTLIPMGFSGVSCCIAACTKPFLLHRTPSGLMSSPLDCHGITEGAPFSSKKLPSGFVFVHNKRLVIGYLDALHAIVGSSTMPSSTSNLMLAPSIALNSQFYISSTKTVAVPRRILSVGAESPYFVVVQSSQLSTVFPRWSSRLSLVSISMNDSDSNEGDDGDFPMDSYWVLDEVLFKPSVALTAACTLVVNSTDYVALCKAENYVVSATKGGRPHRQNTSTYAISVYRIQNVPQTINSGKSDGNSESLNRKLKLVYVHSTRVESPVVAISAFRDRLLVGIGSTLRMYEIGKKQLLRKGEQKQAVPNRITQICTSRGDRIWLGDTRESASLLQVETGKGGNGLYRKTSFSIVADDTLPRWIVAMTILDYSSVAVSDKFGNVMILRVPPDVESATAAATTVGASFAGAECKLKVEVCIHIGSIVTGLSVSDLRPLASKHGDSFSDDGVIAYVTIDGALGVLCPFKIRSEGLLLEGLEREMRERTRGKSLIGRDYLSWRSSFFPLKRIVDGDLCELWSAVPWEEKTSIAKRLDRDVADVDRILYRYRDAIL